jgi:hypothetical protein
MPWLERVNPRIDWRIKSVDTDNFFYSPSPSSSLPLGLDSHPTSEVPAPMDGKFPLRILDEMPYEHMFAYLPPVKNI